MGQKNPFAEMMDMEAKQQSNKSSEMVKENVKDLDKDLHKDLTKASDKEVKQDLHTPIIPPTNQLPTADEVEEMMFGLRKEVKVRVNGDMPEDWKKALDEYAHTHSLGKYSLVMYAVGKMLGKV